MSLILAIAASLFGAGSAVSATLTNSGSTSVTIQVADANGRQPLSIEPGTTEDVCPSGCFVTLPNGDRIGLAGSESVDIHDGSASVK